MAKFDLQLFAEETIEIPEELEGVSSEIASEIMKEFNDEVTQDEDEDGKEETTTDPDNENEPQDDTSDVGEPKESDVGPEAKPVDGSKEEDKKTSTVPYSRFKEVNEEKKRLQERLAVFESAQQKQLPGPDTTTTKKNSLMTPEFANVVGSEARRRAKEILGYSDEQVESLESGYAEDTPELHSWQQVLQSQVPIVAAEARETIIRQSKVAEENEHIRQAAYGEYLELANRIGKMPEEQRSSLWAYINNDYMQGLSQIEQYTLTAAYRNAESGQGTPQDIACVKYHFSQATESQKRMQQPTPQEPEKKKVEKIKQAKAHPRTDQIAGGDNDSAGMTFADIEKILDDPHADFNQIPPEYRKMLLV